MSKSSRKRMSIDNMRVGKSYFVRNHGDQTRFVVLESAGKDDYKIKDLLTLEIYFFHQLVQYGIGEDFELYEL
jgi:hypothetical protein